MDGVWLWVGFNALVLALLALDLLVVHRKAHEVPIREAVLWSAFWVGLSLAFAGGIWILVGSRDALEFLTAWVLEKSLSLDNIFVFVLVFRYFDVPPRYQHRVLFWGIIGALLLRGAMIAAGAYLIRNFEFVLYIFGAFLVFTGLRLALRGDPSVEPEHNPVLRLVRRIIPVTKEIEGQHFFVRQEDDAGIVRRMATPLFIVLIFLETTDILFAVDSIPAIFGVTRDTLIIYSSNVFAILGLRALYFVLAGVVERFRYLHFGLAIVLIFVGVKMLVSGFFEIPVEVSLVVVVLVLGASLGLSALRGDSVRKKTA